MIESHKIKYLTINSNDRKWGISVESVGMQSKESGAEHPAGVHPTRYLFTKTKGRVLSSFQILYLTRGHGVFACRTYGRNHLMPLKQGDMFILFPGEWHTYYADPGSDWDECWIGFEGFLPSRWVEDSTITPKCPIYHVGLRQEVLRLYQEALDVAESQRPGFQQVLGSIAVHLVGLAMYYGKNADSSISNEIDAITQAKTVISQELQTITTELAAEKVEMSYSRFRKLFKNHTGFSPGKYILECKMLRAQEKLARTDMTIKRIALELGFDNVDYFVTAFKKRTGRRPSEYRKLYTGEIDSGEE